MWPCPWLSLCGICPPRRGRASGDFALTFLSCWNRKMPWWVKPVALFGSSGCCHSSPLGMNYCVLRLCPLWLLPAMGYIATVQVPFDVAGVLATTKFSRCPAAFNPVVLFLQRYVLSDCVWFYGRTALLEASDRKGCKWTPSASPRVQLLFFNKGFYVL